MLLGWSYFYISLSLQVLYHELCSVVILYSVLFLFVLVYVYLYVYIHMCIYDCTCPHMYHYVYIHATERVRFNFSLPNFYRGCGICSNFYYLSDTAQITP